MSQPFLKNCDDCPIRHRAICARCDATELSKLESIKYYRTYEAGRQIVWAGDAISFVASIVTGTATLERQSEDGRKQTLGLLLPSDFIGRPGRQLAAYDVTAVTDVTLCCFARRQFEDILDKTPHVAQRMLTMALDELDAARDWMFLLGRKTAREKVATFLLLVQRRSQAHDINQQPKIDHITLPLSRSAIADYLGLTIETVSRQLSALRAEGFIELIGKRGVNVLHPVVLHPVLLRAQTGDDDATI